VGSRSYRDLVAWQQAIELTDHVYACAKTWPKDEVFGLWSEIRRAAVSIAANIAEGQGRNGDREFVQHLGIAHGSLCEVETLICIGMRQKYLSTEEETAILQLTSRVSSLLHGLMKSLRQS
jgi:four helix bundle protein